MKEFWEKYKAFLLTSALIIAMYIYHSYIVKKYERELYQKEIELIMEKSRLREEILREKELALDSLMKIERVKYDSLVNIINKTKKEYEQIRNNYSDIIIERPKF